MQINFEQLSARMQRQLIAEKIRALVENNDEIVRMIEHAQSVQNVFLLPELRVIRQK